MERGLIARRILSLPVLVFAGELSFGMYMLHCVLLAYRSINFPQQQSIWACLAFSGTHLLATDFMFVAIERPLRKLILRVGNKVISSKAGARTSQPAPSGTSRTQ